MPFLSGGQECDKRIANEAVSLRINLLILWPAYSCLYDLISQNFKNRDMGDAAMAEIAEKLNEKVGSTVLPIAFYGQLFSYHKFVAG